MADSAKIDEFLQKNWKFILILAVLLICAVIMMLGLILMVHSAPVLSLEVGDGNTGHLFVNMGNNAWIKQFAIMGDDILKKMGEIFKWL